MLTENALETVLADRSAKRETKILAILAVLGGPARIAEVRKLATEHGLREIAKWNVSNILKRSNGKAILRSAGWKLSASGEKSLRELGILQSDARIRSVSQSFESQLARLKGTAAFEIVQESVLCFDQKLFRAAVVLSWSGAVSILHTHIFSSCLTNFNEAAKKRFETEKNKFKPIKKLDDLSSISESNLLLVLRDIGVLDKNIHERLGGCLKLRNSCAHPNRSKIGENGVAHHIEDLILHIFEPFQLPT